jgi:two-component system CheB/CheR fusion protein
MGLMRDPCEPEPPLADDRREGERFRSEFVAALSHELRNPLGAIRTSLYILGHERSSPEEAAEARRVIDRQVSELVRMLDDLLDVTRIERGGIRLQRRRLDLGGLVRGAVEDNRPSFEAADVRLETKLAPGPFYVQADAARLKQVLANLLSNAAKFTPPSGAATVSLASDGRRAVLVAVADTGCGIEPARLPGLFEPFTQGAGTLERRVGGLGVGLALVKQLVRLHDGDVRAESAGPDRGAKFVVRLPLDLEALPEGAR